MAAPLPHRPASHPASDCATDIRRFERQPEGPLFCLYVSLIAKHFLQLNRNHHYHHASATSAIHGKHTETHNGEGDPINAPSMSTSPVILVHNLRKEFRTKRSCGCINSLTCCCSANNGDTAAASSAPYAPAAAEPAPPATTDPQRTSPRRRWAVRSLSLAVEPGEVLGLLGHNGAGKTTTMRIITGETAPTRGHVCIGGHAVDTDRRDAYRQLGYCPQHDALWRCLTVREHLEVYAAIRGVSIGGTREMGFLLVQFVGFVLLHRSLITYIRNFAGDLQY